VSPEWKDVDDSMQATAAVDQRNVPENT